MTDIHHWTFGYSKGYSDNYDSIFSKKQDNPEREAGGRVAKKKTYKGKSLKPGGGGKFAKMVDAMRAKGMSVTQAKAIAAVAGRKKYGAHKMATWAAQGKKRAAAKRGIRRRK